MVWGHLFQHTGETLHATLEVLSVGRAPLLDGELAPCVLGGLRSSQEGLNKVEPTQPKASVLHKPRHAQRLRKKDLTQRNCHACSGCEFRWDPTYEATILAPSRPNAYPGAETFLPDKLHQILHLSTTNRSNEEMIFFGWLCSRAHFSLKNLKKKICQWWHTNRDFHQILSLIGLPTIFHFPPQYSLC